MEHVHILRASRGGYANAIPVGKAGIKWVDDDFNETTPPEKIRCEHPKHWEWGTGTRNGQKLWFPLGEMFAQKWKMTKQQLKEAVEQYDMASLEMKTRLICNNCAKKNETEK